MCEVRFDGGMLKGGFRPYVWEVTPVERAPLNYVGRTGDSSSTNAQSPFNRLGQHLGVAKNSNMLRLHLTLHGERPESCAFRLVAVGPIGQEAETPGRPEHDEQRNLVAAIGKALAEFLGSSALKAMNRVASRKTLDEIRFKQVRAAFGRAFAQLSTDDDCNSNERRTEC